MENRIKRDIHLLESYAGMTHKMNDNQGRPKLDQAIEHILSELEKKDKEYEELTEASKELCKTVNLMKKVINEMAKHIHLSGDYECLNKECEDDGSKDCEECIKEYFTNKVEKEGIKE